VQPRLDGSLDDALSWDRQPTWPVNADEWAQAWKQKLGELPDRDSEPRRLDYLLYRGLEIAEAGMVTLSDDIRSALRPPPRLGRRRRTRAEPIALPAKVLETVTRAARPLLDVGRRWIWM
jgi:hypothetical protein